MQLPELKPPGRPPGRRRPPDLPPRRPPGHAAARPPDGTAETSTGSPDAGTLARGTAGTGAAAGSPPENVLQAHKPDAGTGTPAPGEEPPGHRTPPACCWTCTGSGTVRRRRDGRREDLDGTRLPGLAAGTPDTGTAGKTSTGTTARTTARDGTRNARQEADRRRDTRRQEAGTLLDAYRPARLARRTGTAPTGVDPLDLPPLWRVCRLPTG